MGWVKNKGTYKYIDKPYGFNTATGESTPDIEDLIEAISFAETDTFTSKGIDPYRRTFHQPIDPITNKPLGSSAHGPLQITKGLVTGPGYDDIGFSPMIDKWVQDYYIPQRNLALDYGKEPHKKGYHPRYDYSINPDDKNIKYDPKIHDAYGKGDDTDADKVLYDIMGKSLIEHIYESVGYDLDEFIETWRFGTDKKKWGKDTEYIKKVKSKLK